MHSVSEIYITLANLINPNKIRPNVEYLGVTGGENMPPIAPIVYSLAPNTPAGTATGFTLDDIYHLVKDSTRPVTSTHTFAPAGAPNDTTGHSIEDIYREMTALIQPINIKIGTTYLGVPGSANESWYVVLGSDIIE